MLYLVSRLCYLFQQCCCFDDLDQGKNQSSSLTGKFEIATSHNISAPSIPFVLFVGPFVSAHVGPLNMHFGGVLTCTIVLYINGYAY